ncbi:MAG: hypothetical protein K2F57_02240, partial [Candidatus Gastranaerophilales bacterium]|nr:hypothetical protein [Candidatus Gastranaerophilales bacterium]
DKREVGGSSPLRPRLKEDRIFPNPLLFCVHLVDENHTNREVYFGSSVSELRTKELSLEQVKLVKRKSVGIVDESNIIEFIGVYWCFLYMLKSK